MKEKLPINQLLAINPIMKKLIFLLLILPFYAISQDTIAQHYKIYSTSRQKQVSVDDIVNDMAGADVLFFGEEHNDSTGHYLEFELLKKLAGKYPDKVALSMEMFETDCQTVLNEYLKGLIREKSLITDARTWPNYKDYRPLIELAKTNNLPVNAANAPSRYTHMVSAGGLNSLQQLDVVAKSYLPPLPIDTTTGPYYEKFVNIMGGHAVMGGMQMYQAQNLWDATMGWSIARFYKKHKNYKLLQINGGFHSEEHLGIVSQLKKYAPKARVATIAVYSDNNNYDDPDWSKLKLMG
ncbi:MAG: hypothetical protein JWQ06_338, partial [Mucilaginibacter sp.]|nr:hypothetical protein [Mucilaginibacter sp.]